MCTYNEDINLYWSEQMQNVSVLQFRQHGSALPAIWYLSKLSRILFTFEVQRALHSHDATGRPWILNLHEIFAWYSHRLLSGCGDMHIRSWDPGGQAPGSISLVCQLSVGTLSCSFVRKAEYSSVPRTPCHSRCQVSTCLSYAQFASEQDQ